MVDCKDNCLVIYHGTAMGLRSLFDTWIYAWLFLITTEGTPPFWGSMLVFGGVNTLTSVNGGP